MKSKILLALSMLALTCSISQAAQEPQDVFSFATYNWATSNKEITRAARCKAVDEALYGKQKSDYEKIAGVVGLISGKDSHQLLEYQLAFQHLTSYYKGYIAALSTREASIRIKTLNTITRDLNCDSLNDFLSTDPPTSPP